jgi:Fur family transcriptional regulator, ferric uptake regulator
MSVRRAVVSSRIRERLGGSGRRRTAARTTVLEHLAARGRPLAHGEIAAGTAGLDRVTLYRTLAALEAAGLVHRVRGHEGAWRFCAHAGAGGGCPGNHPHFQCTRCGAMRCLADQALPRVRVPRDSLVIGKQLLVHGLCPRCARAKAGR